KGVDDVPRRDGDELSALNGVADWRRGHDGAGLEVPEVLAGLGVERDEVAVPHGREQHLSASCEHAVGQRALEDLEVPHRPARLRIQRLDPADAAGSPGFAVTLAGTASRPMYCRPASYVTGALANPWPPSRYSR